MKSLLKAEAFFDRMITFLAQLGSWLLPGVMLVVCLEVTMRYFLNRPISWAVEASEFSIWFITFLGIAWLLKEEGHVNVEFVLDYLSPKNQAFLNFLTSIIGTAICLMVFIYGIQSTWIAFKFGRVTRTAMMVKQWPLLMIMPIGLLFLSIQFVRRSLGFFRKWKKLQSE